MRRIFGIVVLWTLGVSALVFIHYGAFYADGSINPGGAFLCGLLDTHIAVIAIMWFIMWAFEPRIKTNE